MIRIILCVLVIVSICPLAFAAGNQVQIDYVGSALWNTPMDAAVDGNYAYCIFPYGLIVLDISDPNIPTEVSRLYLEKAECVAVDGSTVT